MGTVGHYFLVTTVFAIGLVVVAVLPHREHGLIRVPRRICARVGPVGVIVSACVASSADASGWWIAIVWASVIVFWGALSTALAAFVFDNASSRRVERA